ncbi:putative WD40/YVTN repeat-like-containing domain-containing protein [Lupinus albus]|uniref:Putative WD40/YVTN repeat-like-containing domain-containing protein n=1 Tax=Lupinus albus TaxID=3870 RepID=A0A6A4R5W4_LUPAL|nr:putative WD40/YVTN repeat-like-containing domain-containing protein [Lupinus albus]
MGTHNFVLPLLFLLFVFDSSTSSSIWIHRKLVTSDSDSNKTETPSHDSPPPSEKKQDPIPNPVANETMNNKEGPSNGNNGTISPYPTPSVPKVENVKEKEKEDKDSAPSANAPPPPVNAPPPPPVVANSGEQEEKKKKEEKSGEQEKDKNKNEGESGEQEKEKKKKEGENGSQPVTNETCNGPNKCKDDGDMVACISITDPRYLVVLIQNNGDGAIKVKPPVESYHGDIEVGKHQTEKINISLNSREITQLTLTAGKGDCVLHVDALEPKAIFFLRLPSFDNILTPVNGAYFLIFAVLVFGGTWGCCKLRKKRHGEVPYQELEMALPESVSATNVESAEGWDQDWDDDWDDNVAVKSPVAHHARSISANGLTSRSSNKDGWENNWDD